MKQHLFTLTKKDFKVQTFTSGGPGGQHQNRVETGVRISHPASGAVEESRSEKSQHQNKKIAFRRLVDSKKFQVWLRLKAAEISTGETIEQYVEKAMRPENIKMEIKDEKNKWVEYNGELT
jgi:protein subunit release factor B